jgi:hypothetical protein
MKQLTRSKWLSIAGLLLALPAAYVLFSSILKYEFGINGPFDEAEPMLVKWGLREPLGWNINLLILLGTVAGLLLTMFQVLQIKWAFTKEAFQFQFTVKKRWFPILVATFTVSILAVLFLYLLGENCTC